VSKKYLTKKEKHYLVRRIVTGSFVFFVLFLFLVPFLLPSTAHALGVEPVWQVLSSDQDMGGQVQKVWKSLITAVNSLAVLALIVVAFAEILRINVNTYGVKKILPTLVLAIIAANFSYMFCRLMVDLANVSLQFVGSIGGSAGIGLELPDDFGWDTAVAWWNQFFNKILLQNFILFVLAILLLCLAFLFLVRNWMLYILVMISPLAIMAMVLPSTKKFFSQWWTNMIQWSFMPVVSYFFLALSLTLGTSIALKAPLMGSVFVGVCYYLAITTPFKLGGTVMQNFYKGTGAKFLAGKTKEFGETKAKGLGMRAWNNYQQVGLDAQRGANWLGKTALGKNIGKHWAGNALLNAKANLEHEESRNKGLVEGIKARHYYGQGNKLQMEREYNNNREGEIKEYEAYALLDLVRKGLDSNGKGQDGKDFQQLIDWRLGSGMAKRRMATAESLRAGMISNGVTSTINGRLIDKTSKTEEETQELEKQIDTIKADKTLSDDEKKRQIEPLQERVDDISAPAKEAWRNLTGLDESGVKSLQQLMIYAVTQQTSSEALQSKAENDTRDKTAMQIVGIHEVAELADEVEKTSKAFSNLPTDAKKLFDEVRSGARDIKSLTDQEKASHDSYTRYLTQKARAETVLQQHGLLAVDDEFHGDVHNKDEKKIMDGVAERKDGYTQALEKRFGKNIPYYLRDQITMGSDGHYTLHKQERTTYTRFAGVANAKTNGRVEGYAALQTDALLNILENGDKKDGISSDMAQAFANGELVLNDKGEPDPNKNSRLSAAWGGISRQLSNSTTAQPAAEGLMRVLDENRIRRIAQHWVADEKNRYGGDDNYKNLARVVDPNSGASHGEVRNAMKEFYTSVGQTNRQGLHGTIRRFLPNTIYT